MQTSFPLSCLPQRGDTKILSLFWDMGSLPVTVVIVMNPKMLRNSTLCLDTSEYKPKGHGSDQPRTSYLFRRAAAAGSQCKCSCCLRHPLGAGWDHPRHIWHSLHSGLSHLSQFLCQLSPAWKDPKTQDFFGHGLNMIWNPPWLNPTFCRSCISPLCGQFPLSGPHALTVH